jgi:hypothetical protein
MTGAPHCNANKAKNVDKNYDNPNQKNVHNILHKKFLPVQNTETIFNW